MLLLDEPFSAPDRVAGSGVRAALGRPSATFKAGGTRHARSADAQRFCDQAILLDRGRIQIVVPADEVVKGIDRGSA